jgi:hypothetical protein
MDIKDAEYQEWKEDSYDYNKPKISFFTKKPLNNTVIIAEDWWLKPMMVQSAVLCQEVGSKGQYISDYKKVGRDVRVVGTKLQLYNLFCKMSDEKGWQIKDEWDAEVKDKYLHLYMKNNLRPIIINLK